MENFNTVPDKGTFGGSVEVVNQNFSLAQQEMEVLQNKCENESARAIEAENSLRQLYNNLQQSQPIPVTSLPATGEVGKIYRLAGTTSYADYMYAEGALTTPIKMAEYNNAIDDEPTAGSDNLVKSGSVFEANCDKNTQEISETTHKSGWQPLKKAIQGYVLIEANSRIALTTTKNKAQSVFLVKNTNNKNGVLVYLENTYTYYFNQDSFDGFVAKITTINQNELLCENFNKDIDYMSDWQAGYFDNGTFHSGGDDWVFGTIRANKGHYYMIPICNTLSIQNIVNLDTNGEFLSINRTVINPARLTDYQSSYPIVHTYALVKAESERLGITLNLGLHGFGTNITIQSLCHFPFVDITQDRSLNHLSLFLKVEKKLNVFNQFGKFIKVITSKSQNAEVGLIRGDTGIVDNSFTGYFTSDYITVNQFSYLFGTLVMPAPSWGGVALYDNEKNYLGSLPYNNNTEDSLVLINPQDKSHIINTTLEAYPNVAYIRVCFLSNTPTAKLYIAVPEDNIIDYTTRDIHYATIPGFLGNSGFANTELGLFRTPLIRVKEGEIWAFTGTYANYSAVPAVRGYSNDKLDGMVNLVTKNGKLKDFIFKIPAGVNYICGWGERGLSPLTQSSYREINSTCYLKKVKDNVTIIVGKNGGTTVSSTSLLEGILMATEGYDNTVIVEDGTYDLISEFESYYGSTFFTNYNNSVKGIYLKNRVNVIFSSGAKVICHYTGDNTSVQQEFSPFNADAYGFTINNLYLRCSRVRYGVHDERGGSTDSYKNTYLNCDMQIDNTNNDVWHSSQAIGGGLGMHGTIIIRDSVFEKIDPHSSSWSLAAVSYHNSSLEDAQSRIVFTGNYIKGNDTFRISWYGQSTLISTAIVSNNSLGRDILHTAENEQAYNVRNTEVIEWNNNVRN